MTMAIKRKRNSELNEAHTDKISDLPDCILSHILSFLPTKVAISTSVLSKRWKPLPLSLTTIDLDDTSFCFRDQPQFSFVTFVYRIFLLRPLDVPVKTFRLKCETSYGHDVDAWIRGAIQRKAERLDITVPATVSGLGLWSVVFNCEWLVELRLMSAFEMIRGISSPVNLPSLKILRLEGVRFSDYKCFFNVLAGCTNLQHLVLKDLAFFYANHNYESYLSFMMNLEKLRLSHLVTANVPARFFILQVVHNVRYLYLKFFPYPHPIPTFNNLVHMELNILNYNWDLITKMLQNSPKLESLVILKQRYGEYEKWNCPIIVPECLSSTLTTCRFEGYEGDESELQFAIYVMKNARVLRTIKICTCKNYSNSDHKLQMFQSLVKCPRISLNSQFLFK